MTPRKESEAVPAPTEKFARVEERGEQQKKLFVVVLPPDSNGREKDLRSFGIEDGGRHEPVRQKAERFAERINAAFESRLKAEREKRTCFCGQWMLTGDGKTIKCEGCGTDFVPGYTAQDAAVKALEMAKEEIYVAANTRKCLAYGHDERYCAYCSSHEDGTDMAHEVVSALADRVQKGEIKI